MSTEREWLLQASRRDLESSALFDEDQDQAPTRSIGELAEQVGAEQEIERPLHSSLELVAKSLRPGEFHLVAGPTCIGQREVAWCVAEYVTKRPLRVLYVSLELNGSALARRVLEGLGVKPVGARGSASAGNATK